MVATNHTGRQTRIFAFLVLAVVFSMCGGRSALAQFNSSIDGTVNDASGALIPGADVTLTDAITGVEQKFKTNERGYFNFASLAPSTYTVAVAKGGSTLQHPLCVQTVSDCSSDRRALGDHYGGGRRLAGPTGGP